MKFLIIWLIIESALVLFLVVTIIKDSLRHKLKHAESSTRTYGEAESGLQRHHVYYTLKRRRKVVSMSFQRGTHVVCALQSLPWHHFDNTESNI